MVTVQPFPGATLICLHLLVFILVCFHCLRERREPTSSLLWIFVAWTLPAFGALLYLAFGINRIAAKGWRKHQADQRLLEKRQAIVGNEAPPLSYWKSVHKASIAEPGTGTGRLLHRALNTLLAEYPLLGGNAIELLVDGDDAYPRMLDAIDGAQHHVHLQSFLIRNDQVGRAFFDRLMTKADEGVHVRILYDRFGSTKSVLRGFFRHYRNHRHVELVGWTQANPIKRQFQLNLRNHRKLLIVDGKQAYTGGVNIGADNISTGGRPPIRDYHFALTGPIVQELQYSFLRDWHFMTDVAPETLLHEGHFPALTNTGKSLVRVINSGPTTTEFGIVADAFFEFLASARHEVIAATPYFVPTQDILQAFRAAAMRGVDVKLLLPRDNNHVYAGLAGRALYDELLRAGVQIWERKPPFMHAKALIVDDAVAMVGTANLDQRSLRLNYETNLVVHDDTFIYHLQQTVKHELDHSRMIDRISWSHRPMRQRLLENFCNLMTPVL